jgi:hypothetical protein
MPSHDIIDNRKEKLVDHINRILTTTEAARFAVGYLFLSGLTSIAEKLKGVGELRLLIGNTTNRETVEQIAEGYRQLDLAKAAAEKQFFAKRGDQKKSAEETTKNIRDGMDMMDQTDEGESLIETLVQMILEKRLKVKVYTKGRMHAKAYIFDYGKVYDGGGKPVDRHEKGIAIVGSSNLTLSGLSHNTELNVTVQGNDNHAELVKWFEELWTESMDFDETLMYEMQKSWAMAEVKPYDIYMKTIYSLVKDRLEGGDETDILWDDEITRKLADFQRVAVKQAVRMIGDYGGVFVADVVGLGKSYIGAAIVKHFERTMHVRPLIICPAPLVDMWDRYNEVYQLNARVLSMGYLVENDDGGPSILGNAKYRDRDFLLLDECHNFRYSDAQRYKVLQSFLATGRQCCFLTATPRNKSAWDLYHQIKLFHQDDRTLLPIDPPNLKEYFKLIEKEERKLPDLLRNILIRRRRSDVLKWWGYDAETQEKIEPSQFAAYKSGKKRAYVLVGGKHEFFPKRELDTIEYSIEDAYQGFYQQIRGYLGKPRKKGPPKTVPGELCYARYGLWHYVDKEVQRKEPYADLQRAGANLSGLIRVLLFKRLESSIYAFQQTVKRLLNVHEKFRDSIAQGFVPAGEEAQAILYEPSSAEEQDLMEALREVSKKYDPEHFDMALLKEHLEHDIEVLKMIVKKVEPITAAQDAKLQTLFKWLAKEPLKTGKRLIFTQYADTARYLYENLNPGEKDPTIEVIFSGDKSKERVVGRFAPKANPEYKFVGDECELETVVATDVLAEGLNLQDCDKIINYDLHWNPVRLIQRFGRIDRIGSEHDVIWGCNFLPETELDRNLGLHATLRRRIAEIHETIGEDSQILDQSEQLNEKAMYAIYGKDTEQLALFDDDDADEFLDLNEAEEMMREMRKERPDEYKRIVELRDGIRTAWTTTNKGTYVFCQAGRYQQLFLVNKEGEVKSRDIPKILRAIKCKEDQSASPLPKDYNAAVMRVKEQFATEVKHRQAELEHKMSLSQGQKYVARELRMLFNVADNEDQKTQISTLEEAFRKPITIAINRELNKLRANAVTGEPLLKSLTNIYLQHNMREFDNYTSRQREGDMIPRIICSEGLV